MQTYRRYIVLAAAGVVCWAILANTAFDDCPYSRFLPDSVDTSQMACASQIAGLTDEKGELRVGASMQEFETFVSNFNAEMTGYALEHKLRSEKNLKASFLDPEDYSATALWADGELVFRWVTF